MLFRQELDLFTASMSTPRSNRLTPLLDSFLQPWVNVNGVDSVEPHSHNRPRTSSVVSWKPQSVQEEVFPSHNDWNRSSTSSCHTGDFLLPPPLNNRRHSSQKGQLSEAPCPEADHHQYDALIEEFTSSFQGLRLGDEEGNQTQTLSAPTSRVRRHENPHHPFGEESEGSTRPCTGHGDGLVSSSYALDMVAVNAYNNANRRGRVNGTRPNNSGGGVCKVNGGKSGPGRLMGAPPFQSNQVDRPSPARAAPAEEEEAVVDPAVDLSSSAALLPSAPEWQAQFYKTKLCPFYVVDIPSPETARRHGMNIGCAKGSCLNGHNCRFAHSLSELRPLPDLKKTKLCSSYTKRTVCRSPGCPFAHSPQELRTSSSVFYKVTLCNFYKNQRCWNGANCRFAHGSGELRACPGGDAETPLSSSSPMLLPEKEPDAKKEPLVGGPSSSSSLGGSSRGYEAILEDIVNRFDETTTRLLISVLTTSDSKSEGGEGMNIERSLMSETPTTLSFSSLPSADESLSNSDFLSEKDFSEKKCEEDLLLKCIIDDLADRPEGR